MEPLGGDRTRYVKRLPCGHEYHISCINQWSTCTCPECRHPYVAVGLATNPPDSDDSDDDYDSYDSDEDGDVTVLFLFTVWSEPVAS